MMVKELIDKMRDYTGVIHVHTRYSDGSGTIEEVLQAAQKTGVDFLIVTDHNTLRTKEEGREGWYDDVLLLAGEEVTPARNHYLALGIDRKIEADSKTPAVYIEEVRKQGGLGFIVHPHRRRKRSMPFIKDCRWTSWDVEGFTGLELWSYMVDWIDPVHLFNLPYYYLHPEEAVDGPGKGIVKIWDEMTQVRQVVAIGGVDAHARRFFPFWWLKVFPYEKIFRTVRTHILIDGFENDIHKDRDKVYTALGQGHCYLAYDLYHDSSGFEFRAIQTIPSALHLNRPTTVAIMGDKVRLKIGLKLMVQSPHEALLKIIRSGDHFFERKTNQMEIDIDKPGVYRIEAYIDNQPWVFTNPIYVV